MTGSMARGLGKSAHRLLQALGTARNPSAARVHRPANDKDIAALLAADLAVRGRGGHLSITDTGRAHLKRSAAMRSSAAIDPFQAQHLDLGHTRVETDSGPSNAMVNEGESPLCWLARRKGRDGHPLIEPAQLLAGERLRAEFTRAQMMPRITSNWSAAVASGRRGAAAGPVADSLIGARARVRAALDCAGPEFAGLLIDVCCFLKGLADVERERNWPSRSAKVVLQLGLDRLARHYGYRSEMCGRNRSAVQTWLADDAAFVVGE